MRYSLKEPDDETLRLIVGVWSLTWFSSVTLSRMDDEGERAVTVETDDTWPSAPENLRKWFDGLGAVRME